MAGAPPITKYSTAADGNGKDVNIAVPFIIKAVKVIVATMLRPRASR